MKRSIVFLLCVALGFTATAQSDNAKRIIEECQRLQSDGEHATVLTLLEGLECEGLDARTMQEMELTRALSTYECNPQEGRAMLLQYLADYPETAKRELLNCYIAHSYYHSGDYEQACTWFAQSDLKRLTPRQRNRGMLYYALSLLKSGKESAAENLLRNLVVTSKRYAPDATFYLASIEYDRGELDEAYKKFKSIELNDTYYLEIPYYLAGIYLKQGDAERAKSIAEKFIKDHGAKQQGIRMRQIQGAAEYALGNYEGAAEALALYVNNYSSPQRIALYQLGMSLYLTGNHDEALKMFTPCTQGNDAIAQNALLHTGLINLEKENVAGARLALEQASTMTHDDKVREEALYNYALCIHQSRYSPFAESVKAFEQFLNDYPKSQHADQVGEYLVEVYTNTRNYDIALQSINKIQKPSAKILEAKQQMLYRLGVQEFVNGEMDGAIKFFDQSLELARYNKQTEGETHFWKGEALFRKGDMVAARKNYRKALAVDEENNRKALYGIGYTFFTEERFEEALKEFNQFAKVAEKEGYDLVSDTYNRIADCNFYQRRFDTADTYYAKAANTYRKSADYSLYRLAQTQSLKGNREQSIITLKSLINDHPNSAYTEQALYEMGRSYIKQEQYREALDTYTKLINDFPHSDNACRAATERAMLYNTLGERDNSIEAYKEIIAKYPHSEEAQVALEDLKSIFVEMGRVDLFAEYAEMAGMKHKVRSSEIDTLTYIAAEKLYGKGELVAAKKAFDEYITNNPQGAFIPNSHYYNGLISYKQQSIEEALKSFATVLKYPDSEYREEAMAISAGVYYDRKDYANAVPLYKQIAAQSSNEERRNQAYTKVLAAAREQGNHSEVIEYATMIENSPVASPELKREAVFSRAKAHLATDNKDKAIDDLDDLAEDTRTKEGAEAKFLVAQMLFDDGSYDFCEDEINNFIEMSTPHTYWMARSFILLADLYTVQGKTMEAKQYLLSLQNNYDGGNDGIAAMIDERLEKLNTEESK